MSIKIKKRDGREVDYSREKISKAILMAMEEVYGNDAKHSDANRIALEVENELSQDTTYSVEDIQDLVEGELMKSGKVNAAKAYIIYRDKRNKARNSNSNQVINDIVAAKNNDITRENANMNADTPAGMMMKIASERSKEYVDDVLLSDDVLKAANENILYVHDKDYYPSRSSVCLQHPINRILSNGFRSGHGESRPSKRIETASIMAAISMESIQNEQMGGQAIPAFDFYMAPYVRMTYIEELKKMEDAYMMDFSDYKNAIVESYERVDELPLDQSERAKAIAINNTVDRVHQAMEAFIHNMAQIHSRGGNQVVFSSINYGTDTSSEGRCVIRELLLSTERGIGNGSTAIFPIQIWKKKRGVNFLPEDKNYDLYKLACKVSAKRFFPNFINLDSTFNQHEKWNAEDPERYKWETSTMGCVDGKEVVTYKFEDYIYTESFKNMWNRLSKKFSIQPQAKEGYKEGEFIDLAGVSIMDRTYFVDCYRIIKNKDNGDWMKVTLSNGRTLLCTSDHPWSLYNKDMIKKTSDLSIDDEIEIADDYAEHNKQRHCTNNMAWLKGFILCDGRYDNQMMSTIALNEEDILDKYCSIAENEIGVEMFINERHRGKKGNYYELKMYSTPQAKKFVSELKSDFSGIQKINRSIPNWVFNSTQGEKIAFLAGIVDADGYINSQRERAKVQVGSTNKVLAIQTMVLAHSIGIPAKIYENHYCSERPSAIRYRVEFDAFPELLQEMASEKKKQHYSVLTYPIRNYYGKVLKIEKIGYRGEYSYDVTTKTEHFNVSGIRSHNCRTRVFENRHGEKTSIGRGCLSFSTINLPGLALRVREIDDEMKRIDTFYDLLRDALKITSKQLLERYEFQCQAKAKQFPLLMSGMWMGSENLKPEDEVGSVLKHGTLGIGFIGLAECLVALTGKHHGESEEAQRLGLKIITYMYNFAKEESAKYDLNFSVLATPAEGLSGKFTKKDKKKFGIIPGVTDREYYTNSNHVPVYYKCSAAHKAKIEGPYHELTRGGHIFYVELDGDATHNTKAVEDIVNLMDKYNIGYGSINHNRNRCMDCGYEDASKDLHECPVCKSQNIDRLQRITGYLVGTTDRWNSAKLAELNDRVTHGD